MNEPLMNTLKWKFLWFLLGVDTNSEEYDQATNDVISVLSELGFDADTVPEEIQSAMLAGWFIAHR
jgi:hypothetical protein